MVGFIYDCIYALPLRYILFSMIILVFIWNMLGNWNKYVGENTCWKIVNIVCVIVFSSMILLITIGSRNNSGNDSVILTPFHSFVEAKIQPEMYRSMLMNVFLFFPLGLTLPYALPEKWNRKVLLSILFAMVLSIGIEFTQYHFHLGRAETDDVICNTLGCAIGTISYLLANRKNKASV